MRLDGHKKAKENEHFDCDTSIEEYTSGKAIF